MSASDASGLTFAELASELAARCHDAADRAALDTIPHESLGQALAGIVMAFAAKAQDGEPVVPFGRNSGVTVTDVAIACTAMMDAAGLSLFELGAWQSMSTVRPRPASAGASLGAASA